MTEDEAKSWIADRFGRQILPPLGRLADMVTAEADRQNLVAPSTLPSLWSRHIADSAQLALLDLDRSGLWLDIGTGGGFPGLVLALVVQRPFCLCEPRRLRADFLTRAVDGLGLEDRVTVAAQKVETLRLKATTISARAVSSLDGLVSSARHCAETSTRWLLPRGKSGREELESSKMTYRAAARFHVEHSVTRPEAAIIVGEALV